MAEESYIDRGKHGIMFVGPDATNLYRAAVIKNGLRLLKQGIKPSRNWTLTKALAAATGYTGKTYKRSEADKAIADMTAWIDAMKAAIPVVEDQHQ